VDSGRLHDACQQVVDACRTRPAYARTSSLRVVVDGEPVFDEHLSGPVRGDVFSVTKSVLATVAGAAAASGHLPPLDTTVGAALPELARTPAADHRLEHLLSMTRGAETGGAWDVDAITAHDGDQLHHIASAPQVRAPGTGFTYDDGGTHLLAAVLDRCLPGGLLDHADRCLLRPLGVEDWHWQRDRAGIPYGFAHLSLSADALGRLGQLWLDGGTAGGRTLVDPAFLQGMGRPRSPGGPPEHLPYGWLIWVDGSDLLAGGWAGQHVLVLRSARAVVVTTGDPAFDPGPPPTDAMPDGWRPALDLVRRHVLPVLQERPAGGDVGSR
jgi:CubicO group peptidase (beta-lactamase class C family)